MAIGWTVYETDSCGEPSGEPIWFCSERCLGDAITGGPGHFPFTLYAVHQLAAPRDDLHCYGCKQALVRPEALWIDYENWRGERRWRHVKPVPLGLRFTTNQWHAQKQWLLDALDLADPLQPIKSFALMGIKAITTERPCSLETTPSSSSNPTASDAT